MEVIPTLFDYIKSITSKEYIYSVESDKNYSQYLINYNFSLFPDTILIVNMLNENQMSNKSHYDFLFNIIKKGKRYEKWSKFVLNEDSQLLSDVYNLSYDKVREIKYLFTKEELEFLKNMKGVMK